MTTRTRRTTTSSVALALTALLALAAPATATPGTSSNPAGDVAAAAADAYWKPELAPRLSAPATTTSPVTLTWTHGPGLGSDLYYAELWIDGRPLRTFVPSATSVTIPLPPGTHTVQLHVEDVEERAGRSAPVTVTVSGPARPHFTDVSLGHPFADSILWMSQRGITTGYPDGTFRPGASIRRDAMAAFLMRKDPLNYARYTPPTQPLFSDVPTTHPFYTEVSWMAEQGITTGYPDGTFRPGGSVSREAMAAFLFRHGPSGDYTGPERSPFTDISTTHPFYDAIAWMHHAKLSTGYPDRTYRPGQSVSREAMAAFLHRQNVQNNPAQYS